MKDMSGDSLEGRNGSARAPGLNGNLRVPATTPAANETLGGAGREVLEDLPARVEAVYLGDGGLHAVQLPLVLVGELDGLARLRLRRGGGDSGGGGGLVLLRRALRGHGIRLLLEPPVHRVVALVACDAAVAVERHDAGG